MTEQTSKSVARYDGPRSIEELRTYALLLAFDTNPEGAYKDNHALPVTFRGNPGALAFAVEYAKALDVSPVTAIMGIHMIDGKLAASAGLISALVRRAGHRIRTWTEGSIEDGTLKAITTITRHDDPDFEYRSEWTLARAVRAGLMKRADNGNLVASKPRSGWANYPENMAKARTITEAARDGAEDAILGVHYTPEELGVEVDEATGEPVHTVTHVEQTSKPAAPPTSAAAPPAAAVNLEAIADAARTGILAARDGDQLTDVWRENKLTKERAAALVCGDEASEETNVLDLFIRAGDAIKAGSPLVPHADDPVDADIVEDTPAAEKPVPESKPEPEPAAPEPEAPRTSAADRFDEIVDRVRTSPIPAARAMLDRLMSNYDAALQGEVISWARSEGMKPTLNPGNAAAVVKAIGEGHAFTDATLAKLISGEAGKDPIATVIESLGRPEPEPADDPREAWQADRDESRQTRSEAIAAARAAVSRPAE